MKKVQHYLGQAIDIRSLVLLRILFGGIGVYGFISSWVKGEAADRFQGLAYRFSWSGYTVPSLGDAAIPYIYLLGLLGAIGISLGAYYRVSVLLFACCFGYLHRLDASNFINHYYLIELLALFFFFAPAHRNSSWDAYRRPAIRLEQHPFFWLFCLRLQIAFVYFFAGWAKLSTDWWAGRPLRIWLLQAQDTPLIGQFLALSETAIWGGRLAACYDLTIFIWLSWSRTRPWAYLGVFIFHGLTGYLFNIGLFPPLMIGMTLAFFPPKSWKKLPLPYFKGGKTAYKSYFGFILLLYFAWQFILPLRHHVFGAKDIIWSQRYYRYGWRVMLVEHQGQVRFELVDQAGNRWEVSASKYLRPYQIKRMSVQPEAIREFAVFLAQQEAKEGQKLAVYVDAFVSLNARPSQRIIDPKVNLVQAAPFGPWLLPLAN